MAVSSRQIWSIVFAAILACGYCFNLSFGHGGGHGHGSCGMPAHEELHAHTHHVDDGHSHHQCGHSHGHGHGHGHHHHEEDQVVVGRKLPEELAEEEDLKLFGFGSHFEHGHGGHQDSSELFGLGLWIHAMGCSLLVSLASLICLIILPVIFINGKPSKAVVDSLALFGAGAMLGDAFLHQLPHAFGGEHNHSHNYEPNHSHDHDHLGHGHSHSHSLKDLSVGLSILAGIVLFLLVEKLVRYVEEMSGGINTWTHAHAHHHHHHKHTKKLKDDDDDHDQSHDNHSGSVSEATSEAKKLDKVSDDSNTGEKESEHPAPRKRNATADVTEKPGLDAVNSLSKNSGFKIDKDAGQSSPSLVFGYLNLFSDGVHNFTDGIALGSAFLVYGSVGGWSRTLFLLAHELPQEIGDFGILVRSGFTVSKALFLNFLSALVALAGTALALMWGQDPGHSSLIEGFTAGGFIYISVAGVLAEMNNGSSSLKSTVIQIISLIMGMIVALAISVVE